ncbi:MAG: aldo/keto reductase family protein [Phycisphaerales bacterium]|nr:aldo/keto reductase family protein [Phycisphaerales bacterium]
MKYRQLGRWGLQVSEVGFGSWLTFKDQSTQHGQQMVNTAYDNGINFFDTANVYDQGDAEQLLGKAIKSLRRDAIVLATKVFWPMSREWPFPGANDRGLSRKHIFDQCHASLRRLECDYIDLYQCHRYDPSVPLIETCRAMNDLVNTGKILYWGVSEWTAEQIADAHGLCEEHRWHLPISSQPQYNMLERHWEESAFPTCKAMGMGIVAFSPLGEGMLTGKYAEGVPDGTRAAHPEQGQFLQPRLTEKNHAIVARLKEVADGMGLPLATLALAWCLRRPEVSSVIVGASKPEQLKENITASDLTLDESVLERCAAILGG